MSVDAVSMNFWSVGPQLCPCTLCLPPQPLESATRTSAAAMTPIRRKMHGSSAARAVGTITRSGVATWRSSLLEDEGAVCADPPHADRIVEGDRGPILGAHEKTDGRRAREQEPAKVGEAALPVALAPHRGVDPDLLQLNGPVRPGGRLGLEEDRPTLLPEPAATLLDLCPGTPLEERRVAGIGVDADLLEERRCRSADEEVEVVKGGQAKRRAAGCRLLVEDVDGLPGPVLAYAWKLVAGRLPEIGDRALVADQHARPRARGDLRESPRAFARRDEVRS